MVVLLEGHPLTVEDGSQEEDGVAGRHFSLVSGTEEHLVVVVLVKHFALHTTDLLALQYRLDAVVK